MISLGLGIVDKASSAISKVAAQLGHLGGVWKSTDGHMRDLQGRFVSGGGAATGFAAVLGGVPGVLKMAGEGAIAAAGAIAGMEVELGRMAVSSFEARRGLTESLEALGDFKGEGQEAVKMLDGMRDKLGMSTEEMGGLAKHLEAAGITDLPEMKQAMLAVGTASAVMGKQGESAALSLIDKFQEAEDSGAKITINKGLLKQLGNAGVSARSLAETLGVPVEKLDKMKIGADKMLDAFENAASNKGAGALKAKSEQLGVQWDLAKEKLGEMLGRNAGPLVQSLQFLLKAGEKAFPYVRHGFLVVLNAGLQAAVQIKSHWKTVGPIVEMAGKGLLVIGGVIVAAMGLAVVATLMVVDAVGALWGLAQTAGSGIASAFHAVVGAFSSAGKAVGKFIGHVGDMVSGAVSTLGGLASGAVSAAENFIAGLVNGIKSGAIAVVNAVEGLGDSAVSALKSKLHIGSPSRVMMEMGGHMASGLAMGMTGSNDRVVAAAGSMARSSVQGVASSGAASPGRGSGAHVEVHEGAIVIHSAASAEDVLAKLEEGFAVMMDRVVTTRGLSAV